MRKKLLALLAGLIIMIPAAFADTTFDLVGGFSGITTPTYIGIGFGTTGNSGGTNSSNGLGYAYKMYFDDFDLLITAGPHVRGTGDSGTFGLSANVYLDFYLTSNLFLRGGGGLSMDFVNLLSRTQGLFWMSIEGPYLGIGYSF